MEIERGKYTTSVPHQIKNLITKQIDALSDSKIEEVIEGAVEGIGKTANTHRTRPDLAYEEANDHTANCLTEILIKPFLESVGNAIVSQSSSDPETDITGEDDLCKALFSPFQEEIPELVNSLIVGGKG